MGKEMIMAKLMAPSWYNPGRTEERHEGPQDNQCPNWDCNCASPI